MTHTFMGMTIEGDIQFGTSPVPQRPKEELAPSITELIDNPAVAGVRWTQYTPYFNDGDPCTFSVHGLEISLVGHEDIVDDYSEPTGFFDEYSESFKTFLADKRYDYPTRSFVPLVSPNPEILAAFRALDGDLEGGAFNDALLELFGDHATVAVRRGQPILVEFYEHD